MDLWFLITSSCLAWGSLEALSEFHTLLLYTWDALTCHLVQSYCCLTDLCWSYLLLKFKIWDFHLGSRAKWLEEYLCDWESFSSCHVVKHRLWMGFSDFCVEGGICARHLLRWLGGATPWLSLAASLRAVRQWKVVVFLVTALWGVTAGFKEEYFRQYVILNVHLPTSVSSYMRHWIFIS